MNKKSIFILGLVIGLLFGILIGYIISIIGFMFIGMAWLDTITIGDIVVNINETEVVNSMMDKVEDQIEYEEMINEMNVGEERELPGGKFIGLESVDVVK